MDGTFKPGTTVIAITRTKFFGDESGLAGYLTPTADKFSWWTTPRVSRDQAAP